MKITKTVTILSVVVVTCVCLCLLLTLGDREKGTADAGRSADNSISENTGSPSSDSKDKKKDEAGQSVPSIVHSDNGSGVETKDSKMNEQDPSDPKPSSASTPRSAPTTELQHEMGVESISEQTEPSAPRNPSTPTISPLAQEYADYCAMSTEEQYAYYKKYASADDFMKWYNSAKEAYEKENPIDVINPGDVIDFGE